MPAAEDDSPTPRSPRGWNVFRWLLGPDPTPADGPAAAPAPLSGRVGRYRVVGLVGEGGMGRVHLAEDEQLRRKVALKVLKSADDSSRRRFLREARAAARVSHPNLCPIYEVGEHDGQPFIVMELLAGETLAARLRRGPLPAGEALDLALDLLEGLAALHDAGVVHRDVKPSNLFLTPHGGRLVDFGLAHEAPEAAPFHSDSSGDLTTPGLVVGTPGYMAPEQVLGHAVDARADLFAAGALLHEALGGRRTFGGDSAATILSATLYDDPAPLVGSPDVVALDAPVRRALSKKAADRYASARDMAEALRAAARAAIEVPRNAPGEVFVGRGTELAWLEERLAAAVAGAGSVVFVTGDRGVGKSALVGEFLRRVRSGPAAAHDRVRDGASRRTGPAEAFLPFVDAVGRLLTSRGRELASALLRTYAPTICVQMPPGVLPDPDGALRRQTAGATKERLIREAGDFMEAACRDVPDRAAGRGHAVGRPRERRPAAPRGLPAGAAAHAADRDVPAGRRGRGEPAPAPRGARPAGEGRGPRARARAARRERGGGVPRRSLPGPPPSPELAAAVHARTEGLALFVRSLVGRSRGARRHRPRRRGGFSLARPLDAVDLAPTAGLRDLVRRQLDGLAAARARDPGGGERRRARVPEPRDRAPRRPARARGRGGPATPRARAAARGRGRRGDAARRHARGPLPLRPRALPRRCCARTSCRRAGSRSTARSRAACGATGAPTRRGSPPRSRGTARRRTTPRARFSSAATPVTTRRGCSPTPRPRSTTTGRSARSRSCPPRRGRRRRSRCTAGGPPCASPRPASTARPPTSRPCSPSRAAPGRARPSAPRSPACATRSSSPSAPTTCRRAPASCSTWRRGPAPTPTWRRPAHGSARRSCARGGCSRRRPFSTR